jgi:hypothetical protein
MTLLRQSGHGECWLYFNQGDRLHLFSAIPLWNSIGYLKQASPFGSSEVKGSWQRNKPCGLYGNMSRIDPDQPFLPRAHVVCLLEKLVNLMGDCNAIQINFS